MDINRISLGANEVLNTMINAMKGGSGEVHPQSLLCALGSAAGYACQRDVREVYMKQKGFAEDKVFTVMEDKQGRKYFFGDLLNEPLVNEKYCVWSLIGGAVKQCGGRLPDVNDIFRYVSCVVGGENFGIVRSCKTGDDMLSYLKNFWKPLCDISKRYTQEGEKHILFGIALQRAVFACNGSLNVTEAARIAMESAVSMSKVNLGL